MVGSAAQLTATMQALTPAFQAIGLSVNLSKCELWGPSAPLVKQLCPNIALIPWQPASDLTVLGCPVNFPGTSTYQDSAWSQCLAKMKKATDALGQMSDAPLGHHLLRQCLDACKVNHLLRSTDSYASNDGVMAAENMLLDTFADLLAHPLTPDTKVQAGLALAAGGCGLRCALQVRPVARVSALCAFYAEGAEQVGVPVFACQPKVAWIQPVLADLQSGLGVNFDPLPRWQGRLDLIASSDPSHRRQNWWSEAFGRRRLTILLEAGSPRNRPAFWNRPDPP